jgi:hypothetical protein
VNVAVALVEAFRTLSMSPETDMHALLDGRGIRFDSPWQGRSSDPMHWVADLVTASIG